MTTRKRAVLHSIFRCGFLLLVCCGLAADNSKLRRLDEMPAGRAGVAALVAQLQPQNPRDPQFGERRNQKEAAEERFEREREKAMIKERQKALQKDTDKLLQLATELKKYVDKTNENQLSLDVIKKAEEIEKLAHSVKNKMRGY